MYKTNNTQYFVQALVKLPTLGTFETVQTPSAIALVVLDCSKGTLHVGKPYSCPHCSALFVCTLSAILNIIKRLFGYKSIVTYFADIFKVFENNFDNKCCLCNYWFIIVIHINGIIILV